MRLFNTIVIYDTYVIAETPEAARAAMLKAIDPSGKGEKPMEITATESVREGSIRRGYRDERPFVADDVSDADFKKCKGRTTAQIFELIYTKRG